MKGKRRRVSSPLALAVLATLYERPMHPYEMAAIMRSRRKEQSIKLAYGSLYTVVDNLARHGLIEAAEASREGRRPERTVYRLTDTGRAELDDWMSELLCAPVKEYPQFEAALSLMPVLPPQQVLDCLRERVKVLEQSVTEERVLLDGVRAALPRLLLLESEYHLHLQQAELDWVRGLVSELADGSFPGLGQWGQFHQTGKIDAGLADLSDAAVAAFLGQRDGAPSGGTAGPAGPGGARPGAPGEEPPD